MSKLDHGSKVSLEDLLRLKRAERPNPEFWSNFESELRQKQLTALVQKRRWWHELPGLLNRKIYLPAGAAAIVAFTLVTVRYSAPTRIAQETSTAPEVAATDSAIEMLAATEVFVADSASNQSARHAELVAVAPTPALATPDSSDAVVSSPAMSMPRDAAASASRAMVATLSRLEPSESDLVDSGLGSRLGAPARLQPASVAQSEVAAMTTASAGKYRLIARYVDRSLSPAPSAPAVVRERLARRLGDDLNDDISRIGVVGSRVSLKF
jgi:hypothetical protein